MLNLRRLLSIDSTDFLRSSALVFGAKISMVLLGTGTHLIIARFYGADVLGIVAILTSIMTITMMISLLGTNTAILRLVPEQMTRASHNGVGKLIKKVATLVLTASIAAALLLYFFADLIAAKIFSKPYLGTFITIAAPLTLAWAFQSFFIETLRALGKIVVYAGLTILPSFLNLATLLLITLLAYYPYAPVYLILLTPLPVAIAALALVQRNLPPDDTDSAAIRSNREILGIALPMLMTASMHLVIAQTDILMLGIMSRDTDVGIYNLAVRLANAIQFVLISTNAVVAPRISECFHSGRLMEMQTLVKQITRIAFFASAILSIGFIIFGRFLLALFGSSFLGGYSALIVLAIGHFINATSGPVGLFLNMTGHQKAIRNIVAAAAALNFCLNLILIPRYGISGAAVASTISMIFWNAASLVYIHRKFNFLMLYVPFVHRLSA